MAHYEVRGKAWNFSLLTVNEVNGLLTPLVGTTDTIRCLCSTAKPFVHVSRRGSNYFPIKKSGAGHLHQRLCRHHSFTLSELSSMGYSPEAMSNSDEDGLLVTLAKPLKKSKQAPPVATATEVKFDSGAQRSVSNHVTELGLLHLFWESANMHEHKPAAVDVPLWPTIRRVASTIWARGLKSLDHGLSDLLLLPLHAETENQKSRNIKKLMDAQKNGRFLLFVARLSQTDIKELLSAEKVGFSLKEKFGVTVALYPNCAKPILNGLKQSFENELNYSQIDGNDLIVLGIAQPHDSKNYAQISSLVVMAVVNGHIPYDSRYEKEFALELIKRNRWFKKPLRYEHKTKPDMRVHPDFVLLDTPNPVVIEVYGMKSPEYMARKRVKQYIYSGEDYPFEYWDWDAVHFKDLAQWILNNPLPEQSLLNNFKNFHII
jgi:hypothetical protein